MTDIINDQLQKIEKAQALLVTITEAIAELKSMGIDLEKI